jgi:hypothetical protein
VLIVLGDVPDDPEHWRSSPSFIGAHVAYVKTQTDSFVNDQKGHVIGGLVPLNDDIAKKSVIRPQHRRAFLFTVKENLRRRVQSVSSSFMHSSLILKPLTLSTTCQVDRTPIKPERLASLEVVVVSNTLTPEPGYLFPTIGETEYSTIIASCFLVYLVPNGLADRAVRDFQARPPRSTIHPSSVYGPLGSGHISLAPQRVQTGTSTSSSERHTVRRYDPVATLRRA